MTFQNVFKLEFFGLILGALLVTATFKTVDANLAQELRLIPPPPNIERFVFGYDETVADVLWLRVIQDIHICENAKDGIAHVAGEAASTGAKCRMGWVYHMIDAITTLAPRWKLPYRVGALMLSVVVDDIDGATKIFEKALKHFPNDYGLNYNAAYHYIWEVKNPKRAAELLLTAARYGGPTWFYALAGKLYSEAGQAELAKGVLEDALKNIPEGAPGRDRIEKRLSEANLTLQAEANKK